MADSISDVRHGAPRRTRDHSSERGCRMSTFDPEAEARRARESREREERADALAYQRGKEQAEIAAILRALEGNIRELKASSERTDAKVEVLEDGVQALKTSMQQRDVVAEALRKHLDEEREINEKAAATGVTSRMFWVAVAAIIVTVICSLVVPVIIHALQTAPVR